jgi:hypothetical protein
MYPERISHMTENEQFELVGRKRAQYREGKKELAALKAKAGEWAELAMTISAGLREPELIRWWDGTPVIGRRQEHIVLTPKMFELLTEGNVKQVCSDIKRVEAVLASLRQELTAMDEDPER